MPYKDIEKKREYQRKRCAQAREEYLSNSGPCIKCKSWENLNIDHINPEEKITHRIWSLCKNKRDEELAKCQILCRKCHEQKTFVDMGCGKHGRYQYKIKGCRCDICLAWRKDASEKELLRRKA